MDALDKKNTPSVDFQYKRKYLPYQPLYNLAHDAYKILKKENAIESCRLNQTELGIIVVDYSCATIEAFINYIGDLCYLSWGLYEEENIWKQWKKVKEKLEQYEDFNKNDHLDIEKIRSGTRSFKDLRQKRNTLHHAHSNSDFLREQKHNNITQSKVNTLLQEENLFIPYVNKDDPKAAIDIMEKFIHAAREFFDKNKEEITELLKEEKKIIEKKIDQLNIDEFFSEKKILRWIEKKIGFHPHLKQLAITEVTKLKNALDKEYLRTEELLRMFIGGVNSNASMIVAEMHLVY